MRRFSQRNSLVTLNEINITPLLDLAFVLLIIFVITRPMLEQSMNLSLPQEGKVSSGNEITQKDIQTVEIDALGTIHLRGQLVAGMPALEAKLKQAHAGNPKTFVRLRADKRAPFQYPADVIHMCNKLGIKNMDILVAPEK